MIPIRALRTRFARQTRRFHGDGRGVAAIEFALIVPVLVLLALGCYEVPRLVLTWQKISRTSSGVADLVAQADDPLTEDQMSDIMSAGALMMQPYDIGTKGSIVVSSINNASGTGAKITWQVTCGPVARPTPGNVGNVTQTPNIPAALLPTTGNEVIAAEVTFNYTPVFSSIIYSGSKFYLAAYTRPRNHNLTTDPATVTPLKTIRCPA